MTPEHVTSLKHPEITAARAALGQAGGGRPTHFLAEGADMVARALAARAPVEQVFFLAEGDALGDHLANEGDPEGGHAHPLSLEGEGRVRGGRQSRTRIAAPHPHPLPLGEGVSAFQSLYEAAEQAGARCSLLARGIFFRLLGTGYETAVTVLATVRMQPLSPEAALGKVGADSCLLVGERIQDPRNVGVLIRTADAAGLPLAAFGGDSADPYARAGVRSTTGSIFRVPLALPPDIPAFLRALRERGVRVVGTSAHATLPLWQADLSRPCALVLGNETAGLSPAARAECDQMVTIPMHGGASSFNVTVAAGILCYEASRPRP